MTVSTVAGHAWPDGDMVAVVFPGPGEIAFECVPVPEPRPSWVLVRVKYVGVCGTDVHLYEGTSAYITEGITRYPVRFGHEWSGQVVGLGDDVSPDLIGARVVGEPFLCCGQCLTCRGGHFNLCPGRYELGVRGDVPGAAATYLRIPVGNVHVVPEGVDSALALLAEPAVTILNAFEQGAVQAAERLAVLGTGTMGLIATQLAVSLQCTVDVIGIDEAGLAAARGFGARAAMLPDLAPSDEYDVVVEATGASQIGPLLTRIAGTAGRILQVGIPGRPVDGIDLASFVSKGLSLTGVLGGVHLMPRALRLIEQGAIRPDLLVEEVVDVADIDEVFARMGEDGRARPKLILDLSDLESISESGRMSRAAQRHSRSTP